MNIKSKAFWLQVKEEYENTYLESVFICHSSEVFADAWYSDNKEPIMELATEFKGDEYPEFCVESFVLFCVGNNSYNVVDFTYRRKIRIDFIDWCIEKFD